MSLFKKKSTVEIIEVELAQLVDRRATLEAKLVEARLAITETHDARRVVLLDTDLSDLEAVRRRDDACRAAETMVDGLEDAFEAIGARISDAKARIDGERDRVVRQGEAAQRTAQVEAIVAAVERFDEAAKELSTATAQVTACAVDAQRLSAITAAVGTEITSGTRAMIEDVKGYIAGITSGARAMRQQSPSRVEAPPPPELKRREIYALRKVRWVENGVVMTLGAHSFGHPPVAAAEAAIERGLGDSRDSDRVRKLMELYGGATGTRANAEECIDLDGPPVALPAHKFYPPLDEQRSLGTVIGEARQVQIAPGSESR